MASTRLAIAADVRLAGVCPLCDGASRPLDRFEFAPKPPLARAMVFEYCESCDFVFAGDVSASLYRQYYATVQNDGDHVVLSGPNSCCCLQGQRLSEFMAPSFDGNVLDFGCGQGRLLQELCVRFPNAMLYGHDVANYLSEGSGIRFVPTIDQVEVRFDAIVLSHVVEHLVDFSILATLASLLRPGGLLYVEVPNPREYIVCPRREFMYYFDRLHINHFSAHALRRLMANFGLQLRAGGSHRFGYRDGEYPATYCIASLPDGSEPVADDVGDVAPRSERLDVVYAAYRNSERERASDVRRELQHLTGPDGVLVYGASDNFWRARWIDGPLHDIPVLSVMDQRAAEMSIDDGLRVEAPSIGLARHPRALVVITVSQNAATIAAGLREEWPGHQYFFV